MSRPRLVLLDGHALAYRAFHALPPTLATAGGEVTNAAFGFASMLLQVWETFRPDYLGVAFDVGRTFRHDVYPDYKATRDAMPEGLVLQMDRIRELVDAFGLPVYQAEGWEADDVLGTLAKQAAAAGADTLIVTGDTDAFQLVDEHTKVVTSGRRFSDIHVYDPERVRARYGLAPEALPQWKGLRGDSSDNIPGVPGVGEKTASRLLAEYGSLEDVLAHAADATPRLAATLVEHADQARLSAELATIRRDAPVVLDLSRPFLDGYDHARTVELFRTLDFRSLVDRLPAPKVEPSRRTIEGDHRLIEDAAALAELGRQLATADRFALDTETTSPDPMLSRLVGISVSTAPGTAWYIPIGHRAAGADGRPTQARLSMFDDDESDTPEALDPNNLPLAEVIAALAPAAAGPAIKVLHNAKYDLVVLARHGLDLADPLHDTMIEAWVIEPSRRQFNLKEVVWLRLGAAMTPISELIGKGKNQRSMADVPVEDAFRYACADVDATLRLAEALAEPLENAGGSTLFRDVEMPLVRVLADMEMAGVLVDPARLADISAELTQRAGELAEEIYAEAGHSFNIGSPQQLAIVLFDELRVPRRRRTQTGYSTAADALADLEHEYPIVAKILEWRHLMKLKGTYVDALPELIHPETGRVHTSFGQTAVVTGRLSSTDPNLQNIPVRTEVGSQIRRAFVAPPGQVLLAADYSQMELRVLAVLSGDPTLRQVFAEGGDIHTATAEFLFGKPVEAITSNDRRIAKVVNFGVLYGMGAFGLSQRTGLPRASAQEFIDRYFGRYPKVREYFDRILAEAAQTGFVETILGRRRTIPELLEGTRADRNTRARAEREAVNAPIQGSAADIMKVAMIRLHERLGASGDAGRIVLQVHDELLLEVPEAALPTTANLVSEVMVSAVPLPVPLSVDLSVGPNWLDLVRYRN